MTDEAAGNAPEEALEDLDYAELHERAFRLAQSRRDIGFFLDLHSHTRAMHAAATEGGSLGELSGSLIDVVAATREALTEVPDPELEPLFRARFATYIREHS